MPRIVYVPELGRAFSFKDGATDQEVSSFFASNYTVPSVPGEAPAAPEEPASDESSILGRFAYGLGTGISGIPGGIASLFYPAEIAAETPAGRGSIEAERYLREYFGIDPTKEATISQQAAEAIGSVGSFLIPATGAAKGAALLGAAPKLAAKIAAGTAATQGVALGAGQRAETIRQQLDSGMQITEEDQLAAQRLSGLIGASEALPLNRFFGPIGTLLSKVPASKAPIVEQIIKSRIGKITRAGIAEGAQEAASGIANDIMEYGVYNPNVEIGQDVLSNAGTGAFAGSFVEGVIQLAAGRKLRPYRQLQEDMQKEAVENYQAARQGRISQAAENLRQYNVSGPVEVKEQEIDGLKRFTLRTEAGNDVATFENPEDAAAAVDLYAKNTAAKVSVQQKPAAPDVFPVKIGKKKYNNIDEIFAARNDLNEKRNSIIPIVSDPEVLKKEAKARGVSSDFYKARVLKEVEKYDAEIQKFDDFIDAAEPEVEETTQAAVPEAAAPETTAEPVIGAVEPEAIQPAEEAVIGLASAGPTRETVPVEPATAPEPDRGEGVPTEDKIEPRSMREAAMMGPRVRAFTPEVTEKYKKIYEDLQKSFEAISPPEATLRLREFIDSAGPDVLVRGSYTPGDPKTGTKGVVDLAMGIWDPSLTTEQMLQKMLGVMNHEVIHALRASGRIRQSEWRMLSVAAAKTKVPGRAYTYLDKAQATYTPEMSPEYAKPEAIVEEAIAEMYKDWVNNRTAPVQVRGLFNRITEFFRRIFNTLKRNSYESVFKAIESGEVKDREASEAADTGTTRFSAAPTDRIFVVHGGSDFDAIDKARLGSGEPGGIRPLGPGLYGYVVPVDNPEEAKRAIEGAQTYSKKYGRGDKTVHIFSVPKTALVKFNGPISLEGFPKLPLGGKPQLGAEKLPGGLTEVSILDPSVASRVMKFKSDTPVEKVYDTLGERLKEEETAASPRFSAAPLPPYVENKNRTLFRQPPKVPFYKSMFDFFFGHPTVGKTITTPYGNIDVDWKTRLAVSMRVAGVDKNAYVEFLEKALNQKRGGNFERLEADYSAVAALSWFQRSSQLTSSVIMMGKPSIKFARAGDIQSATIAAEEDPDSLLSIFSTMLEPGPVDSVTGEKKDKREVFRSYATAMRAIGLKAAGLPVPRELDDTYINEAIQSTQRDYPDVVEAYRKYQRFNKNLLTAARDAGVISSQELANLTRKMDYYGFYREVYEEELVPGTPSRAAAKFDLREYRGSESGNLIDDPMFVIVQNTQFWMNAIARNLATQKAFKLAKDMGEARPLGASEKPDQSRGESEQVMFYRENGVPKRFAVSDPMLVSALGSDDRIDTGWAMKLMGLSTQVIRESVTRDPAFLVANLLRDTLSSWITSGENITPFVGTAAGFAKALKGTASFQALMGRGVVGSYDLAMREPAELAAILQRRLMPKNVHTITGPDGAINVAKMLWDRLGVWSEASDAATRIAVYEAAKKQGLSEAEATFRAIQIMDFSRRGGSTTLSALTKLIPFLNARIQGLDVLYQATRAGIRFVGGKSLGEKDANLGKKFLIRGGLLAAISVALEMINDDDEAYEELPDYIKKGNILIPLKGFGLENEFLAIPKPFEAGLLFSTLPQQFYKSLSGDMSTRQNVSFFAESFASTFGVNPIPQIAMPALEVLVNHDFYTGLPLISEGKARLAPELQYDSRTSTLARMLGDVPISYNFTTGKFEGVSPIIIDQLIGGYAGPFGTLIVDGVGYAMEGVDIGPERLPRDLSQMPVVKRFFIDAESRSPKTVAEAYEIFRIVDEANRSFSRLRQTGDAEAVADYLDENREALRQKKYVYKLVDRLNKLSAHERQIERDSTMTDEEKREAMKRLREVRKRLTAKVGEINKALGR